MPDPLAGRRQAVNEDASRTYLLFPDLGKGCPVAEGQLYRLRSCAIEITRTQRTREDGCPVWRAYFTRIRYEDRPHLLARGAGDGHGYTPDPDLAEAAQDDPDAATIASTHPLENPLNLRPPPEPEAIHPDEIDTLPSTVAARKRFEDERRADRGELARMSPGERLERLAEQMRQAGPSIEISREAKRARGQAKRA